MTLTGIHPGSGFVALATLLALGAFTQRGRGRTWLRASDLTIALGAGVLAALIPARSNWMAIALSIAYIAGALALSTLLVRRWARPEHGFLLYLLLVFSLVLVALVAMSLPLFLIAYLRSTP